MDMPDDPYIHPSAFVEDGAVIGQGTKVWHLGHIRAGARIGSGCVLGKNVFVDAAAVVGDRVKIQNNVSVYSGVTIEDEVFVGPSAVFTNDLFPRAQNPNWTITPTLVQRGASIGANATIVCGTTIGSFATVGAGSVVTKDVEPHRLVVGNPARPIGWMCECGRLASRADERPQDLRCEECRS
jgi:UDP-2-acetamido-3-amino-2,3-dideoxy-glucuronate N-acetyltransferase